MPLNIAIPHYRYVIAVPYVFVVGCLFYILMQLVSVWNDGPASSTASASAMSKSEEMIIAYSPGDQRGFVLGSLLVYVSILVIFR